MKISDLQLCTHCQSEVPKKATVCAYCRRDLNHKWYKKIQFSTVVTFLPFVLFVGYLKGWFEPEFSSYQDDFKTTQVNMLKIPDVQGNRLIFKIENTSDVKWENLSYELVSTKGNNIVEVETGSQRAWVIQPNSASYLMVDSLGGVNGASWQLNIKNLEVPLF